MTPQDTCYDICRAYVRDHSCLVDSTLVSKVDGFRRARDIAALSTCSQHFDWHSHSINDWRFLRQVEAFFKKNALFADKTKCRDAALSSFIESEKQCSDTNRRLRACMENEVEIDLKTHEHILGVRRYISTVLGPFDRFMDELASLVKVTPGATAQSPRRDSLPQLKMRLKLFCTNRAKPYLTWIYRTFGFNRVSLRTTYSNRVELVPKNWKTDRTIACEPEGNLPLQLAFDTYAKRKLRRFHIDLRNQSANKVKARHASIHNDYVTVDFERASDTISYNTVQWMFPEDWFRYLSDVRSPCYRGVFGEGTYAKFSSMGNGSTFSIETLLFAGVCWAVGSRSFLVYGDDVIIERKYYADFLSLAKFLGFTVNEAKTFSDGPFRESCGGDYFNGVDVTPVYIRNIDRRKASLCHLVNTMGELTFPGAEMVDVLTKIVLDNSLHFVPWNENTMSGIWIDPGLARRRGILKRKVVRKGGPRLHYYKAWVPQSRSRSFVDSRGYYLWFLYRNAQAFFGGPWEISRLHHDPNQTSSVPIFEHKYVRKWVSWYQPALAMPDHIYFMWLEN